MPVDPGSPLVGDVEGPPGSCQPPPDRTRSGTASTAAATATSTERCYVVAVTKQRCDPASRAYIARRVAEGKTERGPIRCIKRFLAHRVWRLLEQSTITA